MEVTIEEIREAVENIISIYSEDGFSFTYAGLQPLDQPHMQYAGYRVSLAVQFGRMKDKIQIDVGIGDAFKPMIRNFNLTVVQCCFCKLAG